jgi:hypothetical protein
VPSIQSFILFFADPLICKWKMGSLDEPHMVWKNVGPLLDKRDLPNAGKSLSMSKIGCWLLVLPLFQAEFKRTVHSYFSMSCHFIVKILIIIVFFTIIIMAGRLCEVPFVYITARYRAASGLLARERSLIPFSLPCGRKTFKNQVSVGLFESAVCIFSVFQIKSI